MLDFPRNFVNFLREKCNKFQLGIKTIRTNVLDDRLFLSIYLSHDRKLLVKLLNIKREVWVI